MRYRDTFWRFAVTFCLPNLTHGGLRLRALHLGGAGRDAHLRWIDRRDRATNTYAGSKTETVSFGGPEALRPHRTGTPLSSSESRSCAQSRRFRPGSPARVRSGRMGTDLAPRSIRPRGLLLPGRGRTDGREGRGALDWIEEEVNPLAEPPDVVCLLVASIRAVRSPAEKLPRKSRRRSSSSP